MFSGMKQPGEREVRDQSKKSRGGNCAATPACYWMIDESLVREDHVGAAGELAAGFAIVERQAIWAVRTVVAVVAEFRSNGDVRVRLPVETAGHGVVVALIAGDNLRALWVLEPLETSA